MMQRCRAPPPANRTKARQPLGSHTPAHAKKTNLADALFGDELRRPARAFAHNHYGLDSSDVRVQPQNAIAVARGGHDEHNLRARARGSAHGPRARKGNRTMSHWSMADTAASTTTRRFALATPAPSSTMAVKPLTPATASATAAACDAHSTPSCDGITTTLCANETERQRARTRAGSRRSAHLGGRRGRRRLANRLGAGNWAGHGQFRRRPVAHPHAHVSADRAPYENNARRRRRAALGERLERDWNCLAEARDFKRDPAVVACRNEALQRALELRTRVRQRVG